MNSLLERQKAETLSDERERTDEQQHNAQIGENYRRLFADSSTSAPERQEQEKRYATLEEYNILASKITFEQAEREKQEYTEALQREAQNDATVSAAKIAATSEILNSPYYQEAARRKEFGEESAAPVSESVAEPFREESLAEETAREAARETLKAAEESSKAIQKAKTAVATSAEREYYINLAKKYLAVFAVAFLILMTVITINSAIIGGLDVELTTLQQALDDVMGRVADLQNAIAQERSWSSILEYIEQSGMVAGF
jgi:hypothetical protein